MNVTVMRAVTIVSLVALALGPIACGGASPEAVELAPAIDTIREDDLRADLFFLASDPLAGRLAGTAEAAITSEFIKSRFERLGLTPAGPDGTYFQDFELASFALGEGNALIVGGVAGIEARRRAPGDDWHPLNVSASTTGKGGLVYAGFGIVDSRRGFDDYQGARADGKIVLVLDGEPGADDPESPFDGVVTAEASRDWRKALAAQERGAAGILFVRDVHNRPDTDDYQRASESYWSEDRRVPRYSLEVWADKVEIPVARISASLAEQLVAGAGKPLAELAAAAETETGHGVLELPGPDIEIVASVERRATPARNVVATIPGTDPTVADEVVIICAHFDHDGANEGGVFNGADDDGSGTVALLEIAEAYSVAAAMGEGPRRTILLAAWDAEERGLLGAWYYTERPLFPLGQTVATLNMDMLGRNEEVPPEGGNRFRGLQPQTAESNANAINIMGYSHSADMRSQIEEANQRIGLDLKFRYDNNESNLLRRSDHWPFLQVGVPAVFFHTGLHPDYHTYRDTADKINYPKLQNIARLVYLTSWNLANQEGRPALDRDL